MEGTMMVAMKLRVLLVCLGMGLFLGVQPSGFAQKSETQAIEVKAVRCVPGSAVGGTVDIIGVVTLTAKAPEGGLSVALSTSDVTTAQVPDHILVKPGRSSADFRITTRAVTLEKSIVVRAGLSIPQSLTLIVRPVAATAVHLLQTQVIGGERAGGVVELEAPTAQEMTLDLTSDTPGVRLHPASLTLPKGARLQNFEIETVRVSRRTPVKITVTINHIARTVTLILLPTHS
jgi:hypothetical protein